MYKDFDTTRINDELFERHIPLVHKIVNRLLYKSSDKEDLVQAGLMGLYYATLKYDRAKSENFLSYASIYIASEIKKELRENKLIVINKEMLKLVKALKEIDYNETLDDLAKKFNTSKENILLAMEYQNKIVSLNTTTNDLELINTVADEAKPNNTWIVDAVERLEKPQKEIINLKYFCGYSQDSIAKRFNKSQSFVSRLEKKALNELRTLIKS